MAKPLNRQEGVDYSTSTGTHKLVSLVHGRELLVQPAEILPGRTHTGERGGGCFHLRPSQEPETRCVLLPDSRRRRHFGDSRSDCKGLDRLPMGWNSQRLPAHRRWLEDCVQSAEHRHLYDMDETEGKQKRRRENRVRVQRMNPRDPKASHLKGEPRYQRRRWRLGGGSN